MHIKLKGLLRRIGITCRFINFFTGPLWVSNPGTPSQTRACQGGSHVSHIFFFQSFHWIFQLKMVHYSSRDFYLKPKSLHYLIIPSAEHVTRSSPKCLGPNLTSVTEVRESTRLDLFTQVRSPFSDPDAVVSPRIWIEFLIYVVMSTSIKLNINSAQWRRSTRNADSM